MKKYYQQRNSDAVSNHTETSVLKVSSSGGGRGTYRKGSVQVIDDYDSYLSNNSIVVEDDFSINQSFRGDEMKQSEND